MLQLLLQQEKTPELPCRFFAARVLLLKAMDSEVCQDDFETEKAAAFAARKQLVSVPHRHTVVSAQKFLRPLACVEWYWVGALALRRVGLIKDLRRHILHRYLRRFALHDESEALRQERILARETEDYKQRKTLWLVCLKFETRFLKLDCGQLVTKHSKMFIHGHQSPRQLSPCLHRGCWLRVQDPRTVVHQESESQDDLKEQFLA